MHTRLQLTLIRESSAFPCALRHEPSVPPYLYAFYFFESSPPGWRQWLGGVSRLGGLCEKCLRVGRRSKRRGSNRCLSAQYGSFKADRLVPGELPVAFPNPRNGEMMGSGCRCAGDQRWWRSFIRGNRMVRAPHYGRGSAHFYLGSCRALKVAPRCGQSGSSGQTLQSAAFMKSDHWNR